MKDRKLRCKNIWDQFKSRSLVKAEHWNPAQSLCCPSKDLNPNTFLLKVSNDAQIAKQKMQLEKINSDIGKKLAQAF